MHFRMASAPMNEAKPGNSNKNDEGAENEKKVTVLESHGYTLGKTIGVGTYAAVKVIIHCLFVYCKNTT